MTDPIHCYAAGDKVFHCTERRLATVLHVYEDGVHGHHGEIRLDLSGNTLLSDIEPYDPAKHAEFDDTFVPIKREWALKYSITRTDIPFRDADKPMLAACVVVLNEWNQALLVSRRNDPNAWGLPGGKVDAPESCTAGAARELREETSVRCAESELVPLYCANEAPPAGKSGATYWVTTYILTRRVSRDMVLRMEPGLSFKWVPLERLAELPGPFAEYNTQALAALQEYLSVQPLAEPVKERLSEDEARLRIEAWLEVEAPGYPDYTMVEDGEYSWAFWVAEQDTTSYLHWSGRVEWYGTGWPNTYQYDGSTGRWSEAEAEA